MAMEVSLMEGGIARLQSPGLPSRLAELGFGAGGAPRELVSLWRWGALLLLAALAAYGSLISRTRLLVRRLRRSRSKPAALQQQQHFFSDSDDDDTCSSCSSSDEELLSEEAEEEEEEEEGLVVFREGYFGDYVENEGQNNGILHRRLPELARGGRDVVKAWDGRDLRVDASTSGAVSLWDLYRGEVVRSFRVGGSRVAACVASAQPAVVLSAGDSSGGRQTEFRVWDTRVAGRAPAASAALTPRLRRRVRRFGGAGGRVVYVGDGVGSASAVDLRTARSPVRGVAEDDAAWWDSDAVVIGGGDADGFQEAAPCTAATHQSRPGLNWK